LAKVEA
jgi:DNA invertase Pin-like site-specific DNA recombinase